MERGFPNEAFSSRAVVLWIDHWRSSTVIPMATEGNWPSGSGLVSHLNACPTTALVTDNPTAQAACQWGLCEASTTYLPGTQVTACPRLVLEQGMGGSATNHRNSHWSQPSGCGQFLLLSPWRCWWGTWGREIGYSCATLELAFVNTLPAIHYSYLKDCDGNKPQ